MGRRINYARGLLRNNGESTGSKGKTKWKLQVPSKRVFRDDGGVRGHVDPITENQMEMKLGI